MSDKRPRKRGECLDLPRPCPYVGCRYHLCLSVNHRGDITLLGEVGVDALDQTCALDVADAGPTLRDDIGRWFHLSRERIRQIEEIALAKIAAYVEDRGIR